MEEQERRFYPSIFNQVLAPITQGPSSSNTAGPYRIGRAARDILADRPCRLMLEMSEKGGFVDTFYSMDSDKAFLAGVLGKDLLEFPLDEVYQAASEAGLQYTFRFSDRIDRVPTEMCELSLSSAAETITLTAVSLGGGDILINRLNGQDCEIRGMYAQEIMPAGSDRVRHIAPVYPLAIVPGAKPPFCSATEMLAYAREGRKTLWQAALDYECALTGMPQETVWATAEKVLAAAYRSIARGYDSHPTFTGVTTAKAETIREKMKRQRLIPVGAADRGGLDALAIMEYSNAHGMIVCMPTGGASGIIPSAIKSAAESLHKGHDDEVRALLAAGLIGVFYYPTHYHGALGCQAEVGVATSMAAGGLASLLDDRPEAGEKAAVLAMQYGIGQVCDPLGGYVQIPCFIRNIASVPLSMICANYAVLGLDSGVSLDEMVAAVMRVGEKLREGRINDLGICAGFHDVATEATKI